MSNLLSDVAQLSPAVRCCPPSPHFWEQHSLCETCASISRAVQCTPQVYNNDLMDIATLLRLNSVVPDNGGAPPDGEQPSTPVREHILVSGSICVVQTFLTF